MRKKWMAWLILLSLMICCLGAGAEDRGQLRGLLEAGENLLLKTDNVTLEGYAEFSLDGETPYIFKKAEATYVQDGTFSLWRLRLLTPWPDGERVTGFTVIANGRKIYAMEDYHPGVFREGDDQEQHTVIRESAVLNQLISLAKILAPGIEAEIGECIQTENGGKTTVIQLKEEDIPEAIHSLANLGAQFLVRRLFGIDYDRENGYAEAHMADFTTITGAILASTTRFRLSELNLRAVQDEQGRLTLATGSLKVALETRNDGIQYLRIGFSGEAGKYGESEVKLFDPEEYGVVRYGESFGLETEPEVRSLLEGWEPVPRNGEGVNLPIGPEAMSERYQRIRQAEEALEMKYGIRPEMLTFFSRKVTEEAESLTLTLTGMNDFSEALGTYTAEVDAEGVRTAWSHDGENTDQSDFSAPAWGVGQLEEMLKITKRDREVVSFYNQAAMIAREADPAYEMPFDPLFVYNENWMEGSEIRERCRYTIDELTEIGRQALELVYGLSDLQLERLETNADMPENHFMKRENQIVYQAWYYLTQEPYPVWTEGDGIYEVLIDAESGQITDIIYDSGLNGNG